MENKTKELNKIRMYLIEQIRHKNGICRHNHDVEVLNGWVYIDGDISGRVKDWGINTDAITIYNLSYRLKYFGNGYGLKNEAGDDY